MEIAAGRKGSDWSVAVIVPLKPLLENATAPPNRLGTSVAQSMIDVRVPLHCGIVSTGVEKTFTETASVAGPASALEIWVSWVSMPQVASE